MSFKANNYQQLSLSDKLLNLTDRERKALDKSWAKIFADEIFPAIDEKRFSVLYSDKASRPNTPVNIIIGALIIKELFDYSDDEIVENLMFDIQLQYALHTTSFEEQPLSDKTLSRFRKRCYDYERLHNKDLYRECVKDLSANIAKIMKINGRIRRMDSMMIESNIRKLSRMELIYTCISKLAMAMKKSNHPLPEELNHYTDTNDFNQVIYHQRSTDFDSRMNLLLDDAEKLLKISSSGFEGFTEYELFIRCLSEQTVVENDIRRLRDKEDGTMNSTIMQNPSDPEATYRYKAGKTHRGYAANIEESVGKNGTVITDYQFEQNIYSDSQFLKDRLESMDESQDGITLITDGAYSGTTHKGLADNKNVNVITTSLSGKESPLILAEFEFSDDGTKVMKCPAGHAPKSCSYMKPTGQCAVSFDRNLCVDCPYQKRCKPKIYKRVAKLIISKKGHDRAVTMKYMETEEFKNLARLRNGVETVPSILRNQYSLVKLPRGKQRGKFFFGSKIAALNFRKLFSYEKGLGKYASNPVII